MAVEFSRTTRALVAESSHRLVAGVALTVVMLALWGVWFVLARVTVYEVSETARLEADHAVHAIEVPLPGRVVTTSLELSKDVQAGEVLVELDTETERLQLEEERSRLATNTGQLAGLGKETAAEEESQSREQQEMRVSGREAEAQYREAGAMARVSAEEAVRAQQLYARGFLPEVDFLRAQGEAQRSRAAADALHLAISRQGWNQKTRGSDREVRIERLKRTRAQLHGDIATAAATIKRLEYEIEKRHIRTPVAGRLAEVATLQPGAVVREKEKLGVVVSSGTFKIIADFLPSPAVGRIRPDQPARLRLHGFPWLQYGSVPARVEKVASEARDGQIRVELIISPDPASRIPMQHGLPGTVEVEIDRVSPAILVLRAVGQLLTLNGAEAGHPDRRGTAE